MKPLPPPPRTALAIRAEITSHCTAVDGRLKADAFACAQTRNRGQIVGKTGILRGRGVNPSHRAATWRVAWLAKKVKVSLCEQLDLLASEGEGGEHLHTRSRIEGLTDLLYITPGVDDDKECLPGSIAVLSIIANMNK